jgi:antitoxin MazE
MSAGQIHEFATPQRRGVVTIPASVRHRLNLDQPGAQVEFIERPDLGGVIEVRGVVPVSTDQAWFWTERWQKMEAAAEADIAAGRVERFDDVESFLDDLDD